MNVSEVAAHLGISIPSASRRVHDAVVGGWLVNDETRKSQPAKLRLGEPLPSAALLPSRSELDGLIRESQSVVTNPASMPAPDSPAGVFTFSRDTAAYDGDIAGGSQPDLRYTSVKPENVKTRPAPVGNGLSDDLSPAEAANADKPDDIDLGAEAFGTLSVDAEQLDDQVDPEDLRDLGGHGTPLASPRLCPACNQMHSVGTTCLSSTGVNLPASAWPSAPPCRACGTTAWVTRDGGTNYCGTCHPATLEPTDGQQTGLGWLS